VTQATKDEIAEIKQELVRTRRIARLSLAGWVIGAAVLVTGAKYGNELPELRVKRLAVVDSNGVERLILEADNQTLTVNGRRCRRDVKVAGLILQNARGDEMGGVATSDNGHAIMMLDGYAPGTKYGQSERVGIFSLADGTAGLVLNDAKGKENAVGTETRAVLASALGKAVQFDLSASAPEKARAAYLFGNGDPCDEPSE
jgi:hypothetical protein